VLGPLVNAAKIILPEALHCRVGNLLTHTCVNEQTPRVDINVCKIEICLTSALMGPNSVI
jgi:hypothetical protein